MWGPQRAYIKTKRNIISSHKMPLWWDIIECKVRWRIIIVRWVDLKQALFTRGGSGTCYILGGLKFIVFSDRPRKRLKIVNHANRNNEWDTYNLYFPFDAQSVNTLLVKFSFKVLFEIFNLSVWKFFMYFEGAKHHHIYFCPQPLPVSPPLNFLKENACIKKLQNRFARTNKL